jgi:hypothetical protein
MVLCVPWHVFLAWPLKCPAVTHATPHTIIHNKRAMFNAWPLSSTACGACRKFEHVELECGLEVQEGFVLERGACDLGAVQAVGQAQQVWKTCAALHTYYHMD